MYVLQLKDWMQSESDENRSGKYMIWREACNQSPTWRAQQAIIDDAWSEILQLDPVDSCSLRHDLLPGLIVFDTFNQNDNSCQLDPFSAAVRVYGRVGAMRSCKIC